MKSSLANQINQLSVTDKKELLHKKEHYLIQKKKEITLHNHIQDLRHLVVYLEVIKILECLIQLHTEIGVE